jgi:hypothetical protein
VKRLRPSTDASVISLRSRDSYPIAVHMSRLDREVGAVCTNILKTAVLCVLDQHFLVSIVGFGCAESSTCSEFLNSAVRIIVCNQMPSKQEGEEPPTLERIDLKDQAQLKKALQNGALEVCPSSLDRLLSVS